MLPILPDHYLQDSKELTIFKFNQAVFFILTVKSNY